MDTNSDIALFNPTSKPVHFSGTRNKLSFFYPAAIEIGGEIFSTTAHYYYGNTFDREKMPGVRGAIVYARTPEEAKEIARTYVNYLRSDLEEVKEEILFTGTLEKFVQHPGLAHHLLRTGNKELIDIGPGNPRTRNSSVAADGLDYGKILMRVRKELKGRPKQIPGFGKN